MDSGPEQTISIGNGIECKADEVWNLLGKTWALMILKSLSENESLRFNEIKKSLPKISNTVLSDRLHELEKFGLINKMIFPQVPVRVEYSLTKQAKELGTILNSLDRWLLKWRKEKHRKN